MNETGAKQPPPPKKKEIPLNLEWRLTHRLRGYLSLYATPPEMHRKAKAPAIVAHHKL